MELLEFKVGKLDPKELKTLVKEFNDVFYRVEMIHIEFVEALYNSQIIQLLKKFRCTYEEFKSKVTVIGIEESTFFDLAYETMEKNSPRIIRRILLSVGFVLAIAISSGTTICIMYDPLNFRGRETPAMVEKKIFYLLDSYNLRDDMARNYRRKGEDMTNEMKDLSKAIVKWGYEFRLNLDQVITAVKCESDFWKYSLSHTSNGTPIAYGYGQLYVEIHRESITNASRIYEADENIYWTCFYLRRYLDANNQDLFKAYVNYNGGTIKDMGTDYALTKETFLHIQKVMDVQERLKLFEQGTTNRR